MRAARHSYRRLGLAAGLVVMLLLLYQAQRFFDGAGDLPGPAANEPAAHLQALALGITTDGGTLVSVDASGGVRKWSPVTGRLQGRTTLPGRTAVSGIRNVFLDPRAQTCVVNGWRGVEAIDLEGRHTWRPNGLSWGGPSLNGRYLFGLWGPTLRVFDLTTRRLRGEWPVNPGGQTYCIDLDPTAQWVAWTEPDSAWLMSLRDGRRRRLASGAAWSGLAWIEFSPDGERLGLQTYDRGERRFQSWDTATWTPREPVSTGESATTLFHFSPDGRRFATPARKRRSYLTVSLGLGWRQEWVETLQVFDASTGTAGGDEGSGSHVRGHASRIQECVWSPRGDTLASVDRDGRIALWDAGDGRLVRFLEPGGGA